jgi:glutamyl-tRNA synthetase
MAISQVVRGMDLVPSTPRQILLYRMLGLPVPTFGHVALAIGPDGRRLAKRDGSLKLASLRAAGVDPHRLVGSLIHSFGWSESVVAITPRAAIDVYDPTGLAASPWVVTQPWLEWLTQGSCRF